MAAEASHLPPGATPAAAVTSPGQGQGLPADGMLPAPSPGSRPERQLPDDFWMYSYKVLLCPKHESHDWERCIFAHKGERARRRHPSKYQAVQCPEARAKKLCPRGEDCPCTHHLFEYWLHPHRYLTCLCELGPNCNRPICFFAHHESELRPLPNGLTHAPDAGPGQSGRPPSSTRPVPTPPSSTASTPASGSSSPATGLTNMSLIAPSSSLSSLSSGLGSGGYGAALSQAGVVVAGPPAAFGALDALPRGDVSGLAAQQQELFRQAPLPGRGVAASSGHVSPVLGAALDHQAQQQQLRNQLELLSLSARSPCHASSAGGLGLPPMQRSLSDIHSVAQQLSAAGVGSAVPAPFGPAGGLLIGQAGSGLVPPQVPVSRPEARQFVLMGGGDAPLAAVKLDEPESLSFSLWDLSTPQGQLQAHMQAQQAHMQAQQAHMQAQQVHVQAQAQQQQQMLLGGLQGFNTAAFGGFGAGNPGMGSAVMVPQHQRPQLGVQATAPMGADLAVVLEAPQQLLLQQQLAGGSAGGWWALPSPSAGPMLGAVPAGVADWRSEPLPSASRRKGPRQGGPSAAEGPGGALATSILQQAQDLLGKQAAATDGSVAGSTDGAAAVAAAGSAAPATSSPAAPAALRLQMMAGLNGCSPLASNGGAGSSALLHAWLREVAGPAGSLPVGSPAVRSADSPRDLHLPGAAIKQLAGDIAELLSPADLLLLSHELRHAESAGVPAGSPVFAGSPGAAVLPN